MAKRLAISDRPAGGRRRPAKAGGKARKTRSRTRPAQAKSIRSLGRQVGRAESTVRKWIGREDWPFGLAPPWDVGRVRAWAEIHLKADPAAAYRKKAKAAEAGTGEFAAMGPLTKARLQATIERALLLRQRRLVEAGKLHDTEKCQHRRLRQIHEVKGRLLELPRAVSNTLVGQDAESIERVLSEQVRMILEGFASGSSATT